MTSSQTQWWTSSESELSDASATAAPPRETGASAASGRSEHRAREARERVERRRRVVLVVLVVLGLVLGAAYVVASLMASDEAPEPQASALQPVTDFAGPGHGDVLVTVRADDTTATIAAALVDAGVVADADVFAAAFADAAGGATPQAGTYRLHAEMPAAAAAAALLDPANLASLRLTIPPGLTAEQVLVRISEKTTIPLADLQAAAADPESYGLPHEAGGHLEGWLFPTTYDVPADAGATDVLRQLTAQTAQVLTDKGVDPSQWAAVVVKASLLESIAVPADQRPLVARVLENRLAKEQPLAVEGAVAYGLGTTDPVTTEMTQDPDNPYNTFIRIGLPPTAIQSPSQQSIDAVVAPADGDWMFWVTVNPDTGETKYATTFDEYQEYEGELRAWQEANGE